MKRYNRRKYAGGLFYYIEFVIKCATKVILYPAPDMMSRPSGEKHRLSSEVHRPSGEMRRPSGEKLCPHYF
jgi:hypothetical protein